MLQQLNMKISTKPDMQHTKNLPIGMVDEIAPPKAANAPKMFVVDMINDDSNNVSEKNIACWHKSVLTLEGDSD